MVVANNYNKYRPLRQMGSKIIDFLVLNNENIWKLLKYNTPDALSKIPLTQQQKSQLIYKGQSDSTQFRVFRDEGTDDAFNEQCSLLRIFLFDVIPTDKFKGVVTFGIQIISHSKIIHLDTDENRNEVILQQVLETLNGQDIGGIGQLFFDQEGSRNNRAIYNLSNNKNYKGITIFMSAWVFECAV